MSAHDGSHNGRVVPAAFPPPVDPQKEFVKRGLDPEDELIEVGVAIVGGGTAGLACANRLLALLADDPETMERLGEVPVAVIEKAKTLRRTQPLGCGHAPGSAARALPRHDPGAVARARASPSARSSKEAVYLLPTGARSAADPRLRRFSTTTATRSCRSPRSRAFSSARPRRRVPTS